MNLQNRLALTTDASTRRQLVAAAVALAGYGAVPSRIRASAEDGISHAAESIHQEPVFQASRKRAMRRSPTSDSLTKSFSSVGPCGRAWRLEKNLPKSAGKWVARSRFSGAT